MFHQYVQDHHFVPAENKITSIFSKIRKHNTRHGNIKLDDNIKSQIRDLVARNKKDGETLKDKLYNYDETLKNKFLEQSTKCKNIKQIPKRGGCNQGIWDRIGKKESYVKAALKYTQGLLNI